MLTRFIPNLLSCCTTSDGIIKNVKFNTKLKQKSNTVKLNNKKQYQNYCVKSINLSNLGNTSIHFLDPSQKWTAVKDFPDYFVSDFGNIFSTKTNKVMSQYLGDTNYYKVVVSNSKKYNKLVHNLVFYSFNSTVVRTHERQIDHIDRNSKNNKLSNLRLVTPSENGKNKFLNPKIVPVTQYNKNGDIIKVWNDITEIESQLEYSRSNIYRCCNGKVKTSYGFIWKKCLKKKVIDISQYKPIVSYNENYYNNYLINPNGEIVNIATQYKLIHTLSNGYMCVSLVTNNGQNKTCYIHKLTALVFLKNKNSNTVVNHKDRNKLNNHISNLEWCTPKQNTTHATGKKVVQIDPISGKIIQKFDSIAEATRQITGKNNVSSTSISNTCNGVSKLSYGYKWKWFTIV